LYSSNNPEKIDHFLHINKNWKNQKDHVKLKTGVMAAEKQLRCHKYQIQIIKI